MPLFLEIREVKCVVHSYIESKGQSADQAQNYLIPDSRPYFSLTLFWSETFNCTVEFQAPPEVHRRNNSGQFTCPLQLYGNLLFSLLVWTVPAIKHSKKCRRLVSSLITWAFSCQCVEGNDGFSVHFINCHTLVILFSQIYLHSMVLC